MINNLYVLQINSKNDNDIYDKDLENIEKGLEEISKMIDKTLDKSAKIINKKYTSIKNN